MSHFSQQIEKAIEDYQKAHKVLDGLGKQITKTQSDLTKLQNDQASAQSDADQAAADLEALIKALP